MPQLHRTPDIFMIPDNPHISWASMMIAALIVLDVGTEIGEYHQAINRSAKWGKDARTSRRIRKIVNVATMQVIAVGMASIVLSAMAVTHLTRGMDNRMTLVLEGVSRLEAAQLMGYISVKTPLWVGVYHSRAKNHCIQHVGEGIEVLKFHVRYTIGQYVVLVFCLMLPFTGRPISAILGFFIGFLLEVLIIFAREGNAERQFRVASIASMVFAFCSSVMFADGCHYIQVVWGSGLLFGEWGLGVATFFASFAVILSHHFFHLQRTVRHYMKERRISKHDKREEVAINLIRSHLFGSIELSASQRDVLAKEMDELAGSINEKEKKTPTPTTWSLFKKRLFAPSDLVVFARYEYYISVFVSLASLFVVVVNIGATKQMNVVRKHYHTVHNTLYGEMALGPVCAFDKIGGTATTFDSRDAAHSAGYTIAHCGACGQCSTWQDLRLQYTTRNYLAKESARCARKSLLYGREAVHNCLKEEPIGFSEKCAQCWTEDIFCARSHCAFIFLQSNMINTVSNFQVGEDTITAATCEEAMCELEFVPCSGANRRRMNITSTIARPGQQLCDIVGVEDWEEIFGEKGSYEVTRNDYMGKRNEEL
ncbi:hypothetical protein ACHAWF_018323 [Thalassiosira exigua]